MVIGTTKGNAFVEFYVAYQDDWDGDKNAAPWAGIAVVSNFSGVINDVVGLPPDREVEFEIKLVSSISPI